MAVSFTARQLITRAGTLVGIWSQGETPSAEDEQDAFAILNGVMDTFATQRLTMPASQRDVFTTTNGTSTYNIGSGATWNTTRPVSIDRGAVLSVTASPSFEIPMDQFFDQAYDSLSIKALTSVFPTAFYYNATTPLGQVYLYPTPTQSSSYQIVLYTPTQLTVFADLGSSVTMAPGYYRMLYYNLAQELGPAFATAVDPMVIKFAGDSLADIKRLNLQPVDLKTGAPLPGVGGIYSILSDTNY